VHECLGLTKCVRQFSLSIGAGAVPPAPAQAVCATLNYNVPDSAGILVLLCFATFSEGI